MEILKAPHIILSEPTTPVDLAFLGDVKDQAKEMIKLLKRTDDGIGLAAPQVGIAQRFFIDGFDAPSMYRLIINPTITYSSPFLVTSVEGCLSIPGKKFKVQRSKMIMVKYLDREGKETHKVLRGVQAILYQHEIDHLEGILISDKGEEIEDEGKR